MPVLVENKYLEIDLIIPFYPSTYGLYEIRQELFRFGKLKIKINSNENTGHNRPHIQATYEGVDVVCSIDDVIEIIEPKTCPLRIGNLVREVLAESSNLKKARTIWNKVQYNYKFCESDINFTNITISKRGNKIYLQTI